MDGWGPGTGSGFVVGCTPGGRGWAGGSDTGSSLGAITVRVEEDGESSSTSSGI